jgi:3,4-dihydroxy-9,10-secoandrosta-1,3,5(10)-triene-9,17-dione 4,5-dioxygenase
MAISSLGYVRIAMRDPQQWADVGQNILGFQSVTAEDGSVRLRLDEAPFRYLIEQSDSEGFVGAGWECSAETFAEIKDRLSESDAPLEEGTDVACAARAVQAYISTKDPSGNLVEIYHGRDAGGEFTSPLGVNYIAGKLGLGHAVLPAPDHAATSEFYREILGLGLSDILTLPAPMEGVPEMCIHFYHAGNPRHHSLALFNGPAPSGVVHLMTEMTSIDDVGACLDRVNEAEIPITASLGRHVNDGMVSFYFLAPGGIPMEVGFDGLQFDWTDFEPTNSTVGDHWGHAYNFPE